jgi:hypothetical protein
MDGGVAKMAAITKRAENIHLKDKSKVKEEIFS